MTWSLHVPGGVVDRFMDHWNETHVFFFIFVKKFTKGCIIGQLLWLTIVYRRRR